MRLLDALLGWLAVRLHRRWMRRQSLQAPEGATKRNGPQAVP